MSTVSRPHGQLRRSRTDRVIGGVCAGLARYFELDAGIVRLLFVVLALAQGAGVLLYLVLLVVLPEEAAAPAPDARAGSPAATPPPAVETPAVGPRRRGGAVAGALLVALGAYLLSVNLGWLWWWDWKFAGPGLLIAAGLVLLWRLR